MNIAQSIRAGLFFIRQDSYRQQLRGIHYHPHTPNQLDHTRDQAKRANPVNQSI